MSTLFSIRFMLAQGLSQADVSAEVGIPSNIIDRALWIALGDSPEREERAAQLLAQAPRYEVVA